MSPCKNSKKINGNNKPIWLKQIDALTVYCKRKKWIVEFVKNADFKYMQDVAWPEKKKIRVRKDRKAEIMFYYFLHEVGHMIVATQKKKYEDKYGFYDKFNANSLVYKVSEIEEEYDAWVQGLKLTKTLDFKINRRKFEQIRAKCIVTYLMWLLDRRIRRKIQEEVETKLLEKKKNDRKAKKQKKSKQCK